MITFKTFCSSIVAILLLTSCQKETDFDNITSPGTRAPSAKIKTYTEEVTSSGGNLTETFNLEYDGSNRVVSFISSSNPGNKFLFKYPTGKLFTLDILESNVLSIHEDFYLNSFSLVDSTFQYNDTDTTTEKYLYNASKQLVKIKEYDYTKSTGSILNNTTDYVYDNQGNPTSEKDGFSEITYEYYPDLKNELILGPNHFYRTKNLVKTTKVTVQGSSETLNHTYTFDSNKRLSTETITTIGSTDIIKRTYTYF